MNDSSYQEETVTSINNGYVTTPLLGPCVAKVVVHTTNTNAPICLLWRLFTVNTTPIAGMAVVPSGVAATLRLDTSTNLSTWQTITNTALSATQGNRFFRLSLSIP